MLQKVEEEEFEIQLENMRRRGDKEIEHFENLKSKKDNNVKDIKNQVEHRSITSKLQRSEQQINLIENKLKDMAR